MTFATPTMLAGDKSLVSLVAHELAHSWSGNLVTNATWSDFWLNEGFTVYVERRISRRYTVGGARKWKRFCAAGDSRRRWPLGAVQADSQYRSGGPRSG